MESNRGFVGIVVIFIALAIIVAGGYYVVSKKQNQISPTPIVETSQSTSPNSSDNLPAQPLPVQSSNTSATVKTEVKQPTIQPPTTKTPQIPTKLTIRGTSGQAVSSGAEQIAAVGTVEKRKHASAEPSRFFSSIIPSAYAQETTRLVAYIGSFILNSYVGNIFTYDLFSGEKTNIVTAGKDITIEVTDKSGQTTQKTIPIGFGRPVISEQTSKLAFVDYHKGPLDAYNDGMNVRLYDFVNGTEKIIGADGRGHASPRFSRDGRTLAYFTNSLQLALYNVENGTKRVLSLSGVPLDQYIVFSADDSEIYYVSIDFSTLYKLSLASGQSQKIISLPLKSDGFNDFITFPSISENGTNIYYFQLKRSQAGQSYDFVISDLSGQKGQQFSIPQGGVDSYYVSTERQKVYYASANDGGLFELDLSNGSSKLLIPMISSIVGRGTSADDLIILKFPAQDVAEFDSYNLSTGAQKKLFDNQ